VAVTVPSNSQRRRSQATAGARIKFAPQILVRLGEELNPNADQGLVELARNAYDADAGSCTIELDDVDQPGGSIRISDDGSGMSEQAILNHWLVLGRSSKQRDKRTPSGRLPVGEKGLGRLAALRLGHRATLTTWRKRGPGVRLVLDWRRFDRATTVDDVGLQLVEVPRPRGQKQGTDILIEDLRRPLSLPQVKRLARSVLLLNDPFDSMDAFTVVLSATGKYADAAQLTADNYFPYSEWLIEASLAPDGTASMRLFDRDLAIDRRLKHEDIADRATRARPRKDEPYQAPAAEFRLWGFKRDRIVISHHGSAASVTGLREWLDSFGGVHVYHRGLRVHPYGDPGNDWVDMNLLRTRNPQQRPSTNTSISRVVVSEDDTTLIQKTDRTGYIENDSFLELRRFVRDALETAGSVRTTVNDERLERQDRENKAARKDAEEKLDDALEGLPESERPPVESAVAELRTELDRQYRRAVDDLLLYRALATVGTTSAEIAHEAWNPALTLVDLAELAAEQVTLLPSEQAALLERQIDAISASAKRLRDYAVIPRILLRAQRRETQRFVGDVIVRDALQVLEAMLEHHGVVVLDDLAAPATELVGSPAALDAIVCNLTTNAVRAMDGTSGDRYLHVLSEVADEHWILTLADSGPGIVDFTTSEIWTPGVTSVVEGTGLGLRIVSDSVLSLNGTRFVRAKGRHGGAEFSFRLPLPD
jgi:signal transduction histidine kinase